MNTTVFFNTLARQTNHLRFRLMLCVIFCSIFSYAQTYTFAELTGSPTMNTSGWNLTGNATVGDTPGDADNFNNELILTSTAGTFQSGAAFWDTPIDLSICTKWIVEFEFRIWGGTGADGLAFCFLDVPPTGFVPGGGVGIPATANGLKVIIDPYDNCGGPNPELQVFSGVGYDECIGGISKLENTLGNLNFVRSNSYQPAKITYDNGVVEFYLNNTLYMTTNAPANFTGFMGFTSSTGGLTDNHSLRNVIIYTEQAASDAGLDLALCDGQSAPLGTANNPLFSYNWTSNSGFSSSVSNPTITATNTGNSVIYDTLVVETTLSAAPGICPTSDTVVVTLAPHYDQIVDTIHCGSAYVWNGTTYTNDGSYTEQLVSSFGCDSTVTLNLALSPFPTVAILDETICLGETATLTASGAQNYNWSPVSAITTNSIDVSPATTTVYQVVGESGSGCADTAFATVIVNPLPTILLNATADTVCVGDSSTIFAFGAMSYLWTGAVANPNGVTNSVSPLQTETFDVTGTDAFGCSTTESITIHAITPPSVAVSGLVPIICEGESITVSGSGANSYEWSGGTIATSNTSTQVLSPNQPTTYQLVGFTATCSDTINFTLDLNAAPILTVALPEAQCAGETDTIVVDGAISYEWSPAVIEISPGVGVITPVASTQYEIIGTDALGCSSSITVDVEVLSQPLANFQVNANEFDLFVSTQAIFTNLSESATSYEWHFGDGIESTEEHPVHVYSNASTGSYLATLYAYNDLGCFDSTSQWIHVNEGILYYVPNAFTPNGDEFNNFFNVHFTGGFDPYNFEWSIYNRYGEQIFTSYNSESGWDGAYQGKTVPDGVYTWVIKFKEKNNDERKTIRGHVTVIR